MRRRTAVSPGGALQRRAARAWRRVVAAIAFATLAAPAGSAAAAEAERYAGRPLVDVLSELRERGVPVVFASNVVSPELRVELEPLGTEPRAILEQLLAPHGLVTTAGSEGAILVVPRRPGPSTVSARVIGSVSASESLQPLSAASVRIDGPGIEPRTVVADESGRFEIALDLATRRTVSLEWSRYGHLTRRLDGVELSPGETKRFVVMMAPTPVVEDEVLVAMSQHELLAATPLGPLDLSRDDIAALPHLANDLVRAISLLPGTAANDVSAQFHVRGGRRDETPIVLDGQELYEGYHLKDLDSALSLIDAQSLAHARLMTGGLPAEYGDRLGGVLELTTVRPSRRHITLGLGASGTSAAAGSPFAGGRGSWLVQARRGPLELVRAVVDSGDDPQYWDALGKVEIAPTRSSSLHIHLLGSGDDLEIDETDVDGRKQIASEFDNAYLWGRHQAIVGQRLLIESAASYARLRRERDADEFDDTVQFSVVDEREVEVWELKQEWALQLSPRRSLSWGFGARRFDSTLDYRQDVTFDDPLALLRFNSPETVFRLAPALRETHRFVYLSDRLRLGEAWTAELGARFDRHSQTDESLWSPRLNISYRWSDRTVLHAAWGRFAQSQRPYELQVEDGSLEFAPVERSEHWVLGIERRFGGASGVTLRAEAYRRGTDNPRSRFDNLYEPLNTFPEAEPDRVRVDADRSVARGVELFARGRIGPRVGWWANYAYASTEDVLDGVVVPRPFDQPHSLNLSLDCRLTEDWRLNLAWRYRSGWPTTPITVAAATDDEGELEFGPVLGELYSDRLPDNHRLDLRLTREWVRRFGRIVFFVDVQNLYDRRNFAGFDIEIDAETGLLAAETEHWVGVVPSAGVRFEL